MSTMIAHRLVAGNGVVVEVAPRNRGTQFVVQHLMGEYEAFINLRDQIVDCIVNQHIDIMGEVNGRQPFGDRVIFLGFGDDLQDDNRHRWPNTMREIGRGVALSEATVQEIMNGTIPGKAIMSFEVVDGIPQPVYNSDGKVRRVALLSRKNGTVSTNFASLGERGSYTLKESVERENQELLPAVSVNDVKHPLSAEVLAHLMMMGYLVVAPVRARGLVEAQFKMSHAALTGDIQAWEILREDYRQRRVAAEQARGIYAYELKQSLLDS